MVRLEVLPAQKGDCLLLHYQSGGQDAVALIDGGPGGVYRDHLRPRLQALKDASGALELDPILVSHIDDDHVNGVLALARELDDDRMNGRPRSFAVSRLWHNSFERITGADPTQTAAMDMGAVTASLGGARTPTGKEVDDHAVSVLASIAQGHALASLAKALDWSVNPDVGGEPILAGANAPVKLHLGDAKVTVVGPMKVELDELRRSFDEWLAQQPQPPSAEAMLAAYADKSVANLSSVVLLVEDGGRAILLTGDARGDRILEGLERTGRLVPGGQLALDVLKVPHHGSSRNVDLDFFQRLPAKTYVFSGDGEHGNPDRKTFELLFRARPNESYALCLTYPPSLIDDHHADYADRRSHTFDRQTQGLESLLVQNPPSNVSIRFHDGNPMIL